MLLEQNKAIVRKYNLAWAENKLEWIDELLHEQYSIRGSSKSTWGLVLEGKEAVKLAINQTDQEDPTWEPVIEDIIAEGDKVAIRVTWYSQGKPIENAMVFYRLVDGKIIDDYFCRTPLEK